MWLQANKRRCYRVDRGSCYSLDWGKDKSLVIELTSQPLRSVAYKLIVWILSRLKLPRVSSLPSVAMNLEVRYFGELHRINFCVLYAAVKKRFEQKKLAKTQTRLPLLDTSLFLHGADSLEGGYSMECMRIGLPHRGAGHGWEKCVQRTERAAVFSKWRSTEEVRVG